MNILKRIVFCIVLTGFLSPLFSQEEILLEYKPGKGLEFLTIYETHNITEQKLMGIDQRIEMRSIIETESVVEESSDSITILSVSYKRLVIENISPTSDFFIDTNSDDDQMGIEYLQALTGKPFRVAINRKGEVKNIKGLQDIIDEIVSDMNRNDVAFSQYMSTLKAFFDEKEINNYMTQMNPPFPEKKVIIGDSWNYEKNSNVAQFHFILSHTAKIIEIHENNVVLQTNSKISSPKKIAVEFEGINALVDMDGSEMSELNIDPSTGLTTNGVKKQSITAKMNLDMSELGMDNVEVPMIIKTSMNTSIVFK